MTTLPTYTSASETRPIVALLDTTREIVWVNQAWKDFGRQNGIAASYRPVGTDYIEVTRRAQADSAQHVAEGLSEVLDGSQTKFTTTYPCHSPEKAVVPSLRDQDATR